MNFRKLDFAWDEGTGMHITNGFGNDLVRFAVLVQRRYAQICGEYGLTTTQATLLCVIAEHSCGMGELARELGMSKNALTGLVDRVEGLGLARRETQAHDKRASVLSLTANGEDVVGRLYRDVGERLSEIAHDLPPTEQRHLARSVARLVTGRSLAATAE